MLTETDLRAMAERIATGVGRFSPGSEAYYALSHALRALQHAERDVRRHDDSRGLRRA
jgi:hypothetical protein